VAEILTSEVAAGVERRGRLHARLASHVAEGRDYVVLTADDGMSHGWPDNTLAFVQFAWCDDLRLQIETQGDPYRDEPYTEAQHRQLRLLGYSDPFEFGDDFANWTMFREGEATEPNSVAHLMLETLWLVHGVSFVDRAASLRHRRPFWRFEWSVSSSRIDIEAQLRRRFDGR
jgi:hypothetical protein